MKFKSLLATLCGLIIMLGAMTTTAADIQYTEKEQEIRNACLLEQDSTILLTTCAETNLLTVQEHYDVAYFALIKYPEFTDDIFEYYSQNYQACKGICVLNTEHLILIKEQVRLCAETDNFDCFYYYVNLDKYSPMETPAIEVYQLLDKINFCQYNIDYGTARKGWDSTKIKQVCSDYAKYKKEY